MQGSWARDPDLREALFDLLDTVFPGLRRTARLAAGLGAPWEDASTPFVRIERGRVLSHVGVLEIPLVLLGRPVAVGSIHGVATHPEHRRRGLYRGLMEEALRYCQERWATQILTTEHPEYFVPFGFRVVGEHCFVVRPSWPGGGTGVRLLDVHAAPDVALLQRLLATREPVSQVVGVGAEKTVFCFNEGRRPLHYAADLDALLCLERHDRRLLLYDVVAPRIPPLDAIRPLWPQPVDEVVVCFAPDRLGVETEARAYLLDHDGPSVLMVRGPFAAAGHAFTLPRSART
jgi:GNAT superfamily N-acetyltransferase